MINVPETVKDGLKTGKLHKRYTVEFPNGEHDTVDNFKIIQDSVRFTESICSKTTIKPGSIEASVFVFEAHDIPDITGLTIKAGVTVYNDVEVEDDGGWGGIVLPSDKPQPVAINKYIPFGRFIVKSCETLENERIKKVTAYTKEAFAGDTFPSEFSEALFRGVIGTKESTELSTEFNVAGFFIENAFLDYQNIDGTLPFEKEHTKATVGTYKTGDTLYWVNSTVKIDGTTYPKYKVGIQVDMLEKEYTDHRASKNYVFYLGYERANEGNKAIGSRIYSKFDEVMHSQVYKFEKDYFTVPFTSGRFDAAKAVDYFDGATIRVMKYGDDNGASGEYFETQLRKTKFLYGRTENGNGIFIRIPTQIRLIIRTYTLDGTGAPIVASEQTERIYGPTAYINTYEIADEYCAYATFEKEAGRTPDNKVYYVAKNKDIKWRKYMEAYPELVGKFARVNRSGNLELITIDTTQFLYPSDTLYPTGDLYPEGVSETIRPNELILARPNTKPASVVSKVECLWGPYGVKYAYNPELEDAMLNPDNYYTYSFTNNYIVKNLMPPVDEKAQEMPRRIYESMSKLQYTPAKVETGRGLPYVQAGDILAVVTREGGFATIAARRTLTGTMFLKDNYDTK